LFIEQYNLKATCSSRMPRGRCSPHSMRYATAKLDELVNKQIHCCLEPPRASARQHCAATIPHAA
jgi:hypothetical protein